MSDTETIEAPPAPPAAHPAEKESPKDIEKRARKPPAEGPCMRCGQDKPLNRLFLCYPCWVLTRNEEAAKARGETWRPGMPHYKGCGCDLPDCQGGARWS